MRDAIGIIAALALSGCTIERDGRRYTATPGIYRDALPSEPGARAGILLEAVEKEAIEPGGK